MMNTSEVAKFNMIEQQIRPWEVLDKQVLAVINEVNREDFVPEQYRGLAYADCRIPLGGGSSMFPPTIEGRMLQALLIEPEDQILEIGTGSGYITACLAKMGQQVLSLDIDAEAQAKARQCTDQCGLENIDFETANALDRQYDRAFNVIAVTGSVKSVPENLKQALAIGGRMFIIAGQSPVMQALLITRVNANEWNSQSLFETDLPALAG